MAAPNPDTTNSSLIITANQSNNNNHNNASLFDDKDLVRRLAAFCPTVGAAARWARVSKLWRDTIDAAAPLWRALLLQHYPSLSSLPSGSIDGATGVSAKELLEIRVRTPADRTWRRRRELARLEALYAGASLVVEVVHCQHGVLARGRIPLDGAASTAAGFFGTTHTLKEVTPPQDLSVETYTASEVTLSLHRPTGSSGDASPLVLLEGSRYRCAIHQKRRQSESTGDSSWWWLLQPDWMRDLCPLPPFHTMPPPLLALCLLISYKGSATAAAATTTTTTSSSTTKRGMQNEAATLIRATPSAVRIGVVLQPQPPGNRSKAAAGACCRLGLLRTVDMWCAFADHHAWAAEAEALRELHRKDRPPVREAKLTQLEATQAHRLATGSLCGMHLLVECWRVSDEETEGALPPRLVAYLLAPLATTNVAGEENGMVIQPTTGLAPVLQTPLPLQVLDPSFGHGDTGPDRTSIHVFIVDIPGRRCVPLSARRGAETTSSFYHQRTGDGTHRFVVVPVIERGDDGPIVLLKACLSEGGTSNEPGLTELVPFTSLVQLGGYLELMLCGRMCGCREEGEA